MQHRPDNHFPRGRLCRVGAAAVLVPAALLAGAVGGCGEDDEPAAPKPARLEVTARDFRLDTGGVTKLPAGAVTITVRNAGSGFHALGITRLKPGTSLRSFLAAERDSAPGIPVGGVHDVRRGKPWQVTINLAPGAYALLDEQENGGKENARDRGMAAALRVTGPTRKGAALPRAAAQVTLTVDRCRVPGTLPSDGPIAISNRGRGFNSIGILEVRSAAERASVRRALTDGDEDTEPQFRGEPVELLAEAEPGARAVVRTAIPPGDYVAGCSAFDPRRGVTVASVADVRVR